MFWLVDGSRTRYIERVLVNTRRDLSTKHSLHIYKKAGGVQNYTSALDLPGIAQERIMDKEYPSGDDGTGWEAWNSTSDQARLGER